MAVFVQDSMTATNWSNLVSHVGQVGASWTNHPVLSGAYYMYDNRTHCGVTGAVYASGVPADANMTVECDYLVNTKDVAASGIAARMSTSAATMYYTYYLGTELVLAKMVAGTITSLGSDVTNLMTNGNTYRLKLECIGTAIKVYVNGVEKISVTDSSITAAGRAGLRSSGASDKGTGKHIDNFLAYDTSAAITKRARSIGLIG